MKLRLLLFALFATSVGFSQTTTQLLVEHFTNTNCSICGSRNPGLFSNLDNDNTDVLHISYYPSRPYSDCKLSQHNPTENDDRTRYYGLYGSTPQLAIQGEAQNRPNFNNTQLFDSYRGKSQPYSLDTRYETTSDSIVVRVSLFAKGIQSIDSLSLYTAVVEDTVFYKGRNSENRHYNVFRKALTDIEGDPVKATITATDSLTFRYAVALNSDWDADRMYAIALVQNSETKEVYQTAKGKKAKLVITSTPTQGLALSIHVFPTQVTSYVQVEGMEQGQYEVHTLQGQQVLAGEFSNNRIDFTALLKGMYLLSLNNGKESFSSKVVKR